MSPRVEIVLSEDGAYALTAPVALVTRDDDGDLLVALYDGGAAREGTVHAVTALTRRLGEPDACHRGAVEARRWYGAPTDPADVARALEAVGALVVPDAAGWDEVWRAFYFVCAVLEWTGALVPRVSRLEPSEQALVEEAAARTAATQARAVYTPAVGDRVEYDADFLRATSLRLHTDRHCDYGGRAWDPRHTDAGTVVAFDGPFAVVRWDAAGEQPVHPGSLAPSRRGARPAAPADAGAARRGVVVRAVVPAWSPRVGAAIRAREALAAAAVVRPAVARTRVGGRVMVAIGAAPVDAAAKEVEVRARAAACLAAVAALSRAERAVFDRYCDLRDPAARAASPSGHADRDARELAALRAAAGLDASAAPAPTAAPAPAQFALFGARRPA